MSRNYRGLAVLFVLLLVLLSTGCGNDVPKDIVIVEVEATNTPSPRVKTQSTPAPTAVLEEGAPVSCEDILDPALMDKCWLEEAQETAEADICEKISDKTGEGYSRCVDSVARLTGDAELCNKISGEDDREFCLNIVCIIKGASSREECLSDQVPAPSEPPETTPPTTPPPTTPPPTTLPPTTSPPLTKSPPPSEPLLEIFDVSTVDNPDGKLWVIGKIKNKGGADAFSVRVILTVYNQQGKVFDDGRVSTAPMERVAAGETLEFNMLKSNILKTAVGRYEVTFVHE